MCINFITVYKFTPRCLNMTEYAISVGCDYGNGILNGLITLADSRSSWEKIAKLGYKVKEVCEPYYSTVSELFDNYEMGVAFCWTWIL